MKQLYYSENNNYYSGAYFAKKLHHSYLKSLLNYVLYLTCPRALSAYVPACLACLRAFVSCLSTCLRAYLLVCFCILRVYVATCLGVLRAYVPKQSVYVTHMCYLKFFKQFLYFEMLFKIVFCIYYFILRLEHDSTLAFNTQLSHHVYHFQIKGHT